MNTTPRWRFLTRDGQPAPIDQSPPQQDLPPEPPPEQPNMLQRAWNGAKNFVQSIPGWVKNAADWVKHKWDELKAHLTVKSGASIDGVDKRLVHVACAMGIANHSQCFCTDAMRPKNASYGAPNSEHKKGNAMDIRLSSFPSNVKGKQAMEQYVADIATVLGYGSKDASKAVVASRHDVGFGDHMHFQFSTNNLNNVGYTVAGTDIAAAQRRLEAQVGKERVAQIMATKMPDLTPESRVPQSNYPRYETTPPRTDGPRLVYAQPHGQQVAPRPTAAAKPHNQQAEPLVWNFRPNA